MNPFKNIRKWTRKDFPDIDPKWVVRKIAEEETDRDLQKPVQQLLCDVHEESLTPLAEKATGESDEHWNQRLAVLQLQRIVGAQKRMVSLQAASTFQTSRTGDLVFWLTLVIVIQTFVLIFLTLRAPSPSSPSSVTGSPQTTNSSTNK